MASDAEFVHVEHVEAAQAAEAEQVAPAPFVFKHRESTAFPASRVKKIMLADEDVGKIKKESPALLAMSVEMFIEQLMAAASEATIADGARMMSAGHLKRAILNNPKWDFIHQLMAKVADLPEHVDGEAPKKTRKKREPKLDDDDEPKPVVKRAGGGGRRGKKAKEEAEHKEESHASEVQHIQAAEQPEQNTGPVFVPVSLAPSASTGPSMPNFVDEDDFDA